MSKKKIYIAEDDPMLADIINTLLCTKENYETSFFNDGLALYQEVQNAAPDLLVIDIILPSLSGYAISRLVKFCEATKHIPIIVTSSITDGDVQEKVARVGADRFLPKPFDFDELLFLIDSFLEAKHTTD